LLIDRGTEEQTERGTAIQLDRQTQTDKRADGQTDAGTTGRKVERKLDIWRDKQKHTLFEKTKN
jgi:hypothetical protein